MYDDTKIAVSNAKRVTGIIGMVIVFLIAMVALFGSWTIVKAGERGIILRLGQIDRVIEPGFHFKVPFLEDVVKTEVRIQKIEVEASAASKDLQIVTTNVAMNFNISPDAVAKLYEEVGEQWKSRIIDPAIQDSVKAVTALFTAEHLITERIQVKEGIQNLLRERLLVNGIYVTDLSIVDFQFSEDFDKAIEAKVTAEQRALEAQHKLSQIEFEAQQRIETAKAEAEAIRIQAQAINSQGGADYVQLQAISKWNGILPTQMIPNATLPILNLK